MLPKMRERGIDVPGQGRMSTADRLVQDDEILLCGHGSYEKGRRRPVRLPAASTTGVTAVTGAPPE
jgi:hypothetical protein